MNQLLNSSNKDFDFVGWVIKTSWLIVSQCEVLLCERNTHDVSSVGENSYSISAQKTTKKIFDKICWEMKTSTRTWKLVHALHYANELLVHVSLAFQQLLQTRQTSRNYQKQVLVMIKHCLENSQINSIPAWRKEFSYITFLYRTTAKVCAYT